MADQSDVDVVERVLQWQRQHPRVLAAFGGPEHISGLVEAPWPHLRVLPGPNGDLRDGLWAQEQDVLLEVYSDFGGAPGEAAVRRMAVIAALAARDLQDHTPAPGEIVVSRVLLRGVPARQSGGGQPTLTAQSLTSGQIRYAATVSVVARPPD